MRNTLQKAGIEIPDKKYPLIMRTGKNDFGKMVRFYFNYSAEDQTCKYEFSDGTDLFDRSEIKAQDVLHIAPWGVKIIEEKE